MGDEDQHDGRFAGILVINPKGQVFLVEREDTGEWETPGGHVDLGEDFKEAAIREFKEEVGAWPAGRWGDFLPGPTPGNPGGCYVMFTLFLINQDNFAHRLNWEHTDSKWTTLEGAINDPKIHQALRKQLLRLNDKWAFDKGPEDTVEAIMGGEQYADVTVAAILKAAGLKSSQMPSLARFSRTFTVKDVMEYGKRARESVKAEFDRLSAKENRTNEEEDRLDGLARLVNPSAFVGMVAGDKPKTAQLDSGPETLKSLRDRKVFGEDREDEPFHAKSAEHLTPEDYSRPLKEAAMEPLEMGDLLIVDRDDMGVDFRDKYHPEEGNLTFVNDMGADELGEWLTERSEKDSSEEASVETQKILDTEKYAGIRVADFREEMVKRDKGGQFSTTNQRKEEEIDEPERNQLPEPEPDEDVEEPAPKPDEPEEDGRYKNLLKKAVSPAKYLGSSVWNQIPPKSQKKLEKWGKLALIVGNAWPNAAKAVVAETGAPPYVAKAALIASTIGDFAIPMVPIGSVTTIVLASLAKPKAPVRAAKKAINYIRDKRRERKEKKDENNKAKAASDADPLEGAKPRQDLARTIAKRSGESGNAEWWIVLFLVAMEETNGNTKKAMDLADHAIEQTPNPKE